MLTCYHPGSPVFHKTDLIGFRDFRNPIAITGEPVVSYPLYKRFGTQLEDHVRQPFLLPFSAHRIGDGILCISWGCLLFLVIVFHYLI